MMKPLHYVYLFQTIFTFVISIILSHTNVTNIAVNKCPDVKRMTSSVMWTVISLIAILISSQVFFMMNDNWGWLEFRQSWAGSLSQHAVYSIAIAIATTFAILTLNILQNDGNRIQTMCQQMNIFKLSKLVKNDETKGVSIKDNNDFMSRVEVLRNGYPADTFSQRAYHDQQMSEYKVLKAHWGAIKPDLEQIQKRWQDTRANKDWYAANDEFLKDTNNLNWLKHNTPTVEVTAEQAYLYKLRNTSRCEAVKFIQYMNNERDLDGKIGSDAMWDDTVDSFRAATYGSQAGLQNDPLNMFLREFDHNTGSESRRVVEHYMDGIDNIFNDIGNLSAVTTSFIELMDNDNEKSELFKDDFYKDIDASCEDIRSADLEDTEPIDSLALKVIFENWKTLQRWMNKLDEIFTNKAFIARTNTDVLEDDYLRKNILNGFTWCMIVWPSLETFYFIQKMFSVMTNNRRVPGIAKGIVYIFAVILPLLVGVVMYGGDSIGGGIRKKDITKLLKGKSGASETTSSVVRVNDGNKVHSIHIDDVSTYTVKELKVELSKKTKIDWMKKLLHNYNDNIDLIDNNKMLSDYDVQIGSTLSLGTVNL